MTRFSIYTSRAEGVHVHIHLYGCNQFHIHVTACEINTIIDLYLMVLYRCLSSAELTVIDLHYIQNSNIYIYIYEPVTNYCCLKSSSLIVDTDVLDNIFVMMCVNMMTFNTRK